MRHILTIIFVLAVFTSKAEYNGWFIKLKITTIQDKVIEGHTYVADADVDEDSTTNTAYLVEWFDRHDYNKDSIIKFHKNRIAYKYKLRNDSSVVYSMVDKTEINIFQVKKIEILEMIDFSYLTNVTNELTMKDTLWLNTAPIKHEWAGGYLCEYDLFFHENNKEIEKLLAELKRISKDAYEKKDDEGVSDIIEKLIQYKVLIISFCTC